MGTSLIKDRDLILAKCRWIADNGHEWLQVPLFAARVADQADKANGGNGISTFSYIKGTNAYLEGDCDAALFLTYLGATDCDAWNTIHANGVASYSNLAPVRNYPRWEA